MPCSMGSPEAECASKLHIWKRFSGGEERKWTNAVAVNFKVVTGGGDSENTIEMIEWPQAECQSQPATQGAQLQSVGVQHRMALSEKKRVGARHGLTLPPARRVPLRQGVAAQGRGGQGTSCPTRICGRLTSHGRQTAALASTSCFWGCSSCWGSVSPPLAYEKQQKKEVEPGSLALPEARVAKGQGGP